MEKIIEDQKIKKKELIIERIKAKSFRFKNDNLSKIKDFKPVYNRNYVQKNFSNIVSSRRIVDPLAFSIIDFNKDVDEQYSDGFMKQENDSNVEDNRNKFGIKKKKEPMVIN